MEYVELSYSIFLASFDSKYTFDEHLEYYSILPLSATWEIFIPRWIMMLKTNNYIYRMMAICIVQPADLLKTRMQLMGPAGKDATFLSVARNIVRNEGFLGFYTGLSAALLRQATYGTGRLGAFNGIFDMYKV